MSSELLTDDERKAIELSADLFNLIAHKIIGQGISRPQDAAELCSHIHNIQRMVMAQAACRAYPDEFRLLCGVIEKKEVDVTESSLWLEEIYDISTDSSGLVTVMFDDGTFVQSNIKVKDHPRIPSLRIE